MVNKLLKIGQRVKVHRRNFTPYIGIVKSISETSIMDDVWYEVIPVSPPKEIISSWEHTANVNAID